MTEKTYSNPLVVHISELKCKKRSIDDIDQNDVFQSSFGRYSISARCLHQADVVIVVDDSGNSKVFKNRHGDVPTVKNELEIDIKGPTGLGKVAIAKLLQNYLSTIGIKNVEFSPNAEQMYENYELSSAIESLSVLRERIDGVSIKTSHKPTKIRM